MACGIHLKRDRFMLFAAFAFRIERNFNFGRSAFGHRFFRIFRNRAAARTYCIGNNQVALAGVFYFKNVRHLLTLFDGIEIVFGFLKLNGGGIF